MAESLKTMYVSHAQLPWILAEILYMMSNIYT